MDLRRSSVIAVSCALVLVGALVAYLYPEFGARVIPVVLLLGAFVGVYLYPSQALLAAIPAMVLAPSVPYFGSSGRFTIVIAAVWVVGLVQGRWRLTRAHLLLLAFAGSLGISYVFAAEGHSVSPGATGFISILSGVGLACASISFRPSIRSMIAAIGIVSTLVTMIVVIGGSGVEHYDFGAYTRSFAFGLNPNSLGTIAAVAGTSVVCLTLDRKQPVWLVGLIPVVAVMPDLKSRSALGLALVGVLVIVASRVRIRGLIVGLAGAVIAAIFFGSAFAAVYDASLGARARLDLSSTDAVRAATVPLAIELGIRHPLLGVGDGNFPLHAADSPELGIAVNTHNEYARLFAEFGLVALLLFVWILFRATRNSFRFDPSRTVFPLVVVYACGLTVSDQLGTAAVYGGFWVLLGGALALRSQRRDPPSIQLMGARKVAPSEVEIPVQAG